MKILLTGAAGFLGRHLYQELCIGNDVIGTVRHVAGEHDNPYVEIPISPSTNWKPVLSEINCVVHSAALAHVFNANGCSLEQFRMINTLSTLNFAEQAASSGIKRFFARLAATAS